MDVTYPEKYHRATRFFDALVGDLEQSTRLDNERKLLFYALRRQADDGPCTQPAPSLWNVTERYKHHAWCRLGNMSRAEAMVHFVRQVEQMVGMPLRWSHMPGSDDTQDNSGGGEDSDGDDDDDDDDDDSASDGDAVEQSSSSSSSSSGQQDDDVTATATATTTPLVTQTLLRDAATWHADLRAHATPNEANVLYLISQAMHARRLYTTLLQHQEKQRRQRQRQQRRNTAMTTTTATDDGEAAVSSQQASDGDDGEEDGGSGPLDMAAATTAASVAPVVTADTASSYTRTPCAAAVALSSSSPPSAATSPAVATSPACPPPQTHPPPQQQQRVAVRVLANGVQIRVPCVVHHTQCSQHAPTATTSAVTASSSSPPPATTTTRTGCNEGLVAALEREQLLSSAAIAAAMRRVDRRWFVPAALTHRAYEDTPLPIGHAATISAPHMHAMMLELLYPYIQQHYRHEQQQQQQSGGDETRQPLRVLDVGSGSGYLTAVLAALCESEAAAVTTATTMASNDGDKHDATSTTWQVCGIEHVPSLQQHSLAVLQARFASWCERGCVRVVCGDGRDPAAALSLAANDAQEHYHLIHVGAAADTAVPPALLRLLRRGGCIVAPVGPCGGTQRLLCCTKDDAGVVHTRTASHVVFVPLTSLAAQMQL